MAGLVPGALRRPVVLAYHGVNEVAEVDDPRRLVLSPARFEAQLCLLLRWGYRFRTAEDLLERVPVQQPARGTAVLTFDDGWLDGLTIVAPLLRRLGLRATFYLNPGLWGAQHSLVAGEAGRLMDKDDAHRLQDLGMEIGSHTMSHPDLRKLDDAALAQELNESKAGIEAVTGRPCRTFAYPFGLFDERVEAAVADAGYELAFGWGPGAWRPLAAPRLPAPPRHGAGRLALKLLGVRRRSA